jgi:uncharacterized protein (DUF4415 family)
MKTMRDEYDFSDSKPNPYAEELKQQVVLKIDTPTIEYFEGLSQDLGISYQSLINLYLRDCATSHRKLAWS